MSNVKLLGTIPFEGNSHIVNKMSLNSEFNTTMLDTGIQVPEDLKRYITVYYSENENADKDLQNVENAWTTTPSDWNKVRRFLIDFGNYSVKNKKCIYVYLYC